MKFNNKYYIMRHGEALSNVKNIISCWPEKGRFPLTSKGRNQVKAAVKELKKQDIDLIFASDILRTKQTAEIVGKVLKIKPKFDKRLREHKVGIFNNRPIQDLWGFMLSQGVKRFGKRPPKGETYFEIEKRMTDFLKAINKKYKDKNILIISHQLPLALFEAKIKGIPNKDFFQKLFQRKALETGESRKLTF